MAGRLGGFLALDEHPATDLQALIDRAQVLAEAWRERRMPQTLADRRIALVADDTGWRNTTAFDLGVRALGGTCTAAPIRLDGREAPADLAGYLANWFDAAVIRTSELDRLRELAAAGHLPVVNARTRENHPCETLGDLAYVQSVRGRLDGLRVAVVAPAANILGSWIEAAAVLPIDVVQVYPAAWHAPARRRFRASEVLDELADADVVVTDCWPAGADTDTLATYRITPERLARNTLFIPCPPVTRCQEVSVEAMAAPQCCVTAAKAFLLHAQNAVLEALF